jgi:hypothetical protein
MYLSPIPGISPLIRFEFEGWGYGLVAMLRESLTMIFVIAMLTTRLALPAQMRVEFSFSAKSERLKLTFEAAEAVVEPCLFGVWPNRTSDTRRNSVAIESISELSYR